MQYPI